MAHTQRVAVLSRHLTNATGLDVVSVTEDLLDNTAELRQFRPRDLYEYTVRDNIEMRDQILEFLKVGLEHLQCQCQCQLPTPSLRCSLFTNC